MNNICLLYVIILQNTIRNIIKSLHKYKIYYVKVDV